MEDNHSRNFPIKTKTKTKTKSKSNRNLKKQHFSCNKITKRKFIFLKFPFCFCLFKFYTKINIFNFIERKIYFFYLIFLLNLLSLINLFKKNIYKIASKYLLKNIIQFI